MPFWPRIPEGKHSGKERLPKRFSLLEGENGKSPLLFLSIVACQTVKPGTATADLCWGEAT